MSGQVLTAGAMLALGVAVATDVTGRRVPNTVVVTLALLWAARAWTDGAAGTIDGLVFAGVLLTAGVVLYATDAMGAGDAKLAGVIGLWVGGEQAAEYLMGVGVCAMALVAWGIMRKERDNLPFATALAPPAMAILAMRLWEEPLRMLI